MLFMQLQDMGFENHNIKAKLKAKKGNYQKVLRSLERKKMLEEANHEYFAMQQKLISSSSDKLSKKI